ncbi:hypothetical protein ACFWBV_30530 [Streptomyces sp. NPDC060030]|uniref:hypothetical protein n=1 Tax=Streptomyces sp. NPDC060030 TaxID=3347042 RepID=UPI003694C9F4
MAGVHPDLGQDAPALEVGEPVLDGGAFAADQPVRFPLGIGDALSLLISRSVAFPSS